MNESVSQIRDDDAANEFDNDDQDYWRYIDIACIWKKNADPSKYRLDQNTDAVPQSSRNRVVYIDHVEGYQKRKDNDDEDKKFIGAEEPIYKVQQSKHFGSLDLAFDDLDRNGRETGRPP